jgi:3-mercaptopyruvate sulfurtransferase SseA
MSPKSKKSFPWPLVMVVAGGLLLIGAGGWYAFTFFAPTPAPPQEAVSADSVPRISVSDAMAAYELDQAVFVDVRDADSYAQGHIREAISIPLQDLPQRIGELDPEDWIITY